MSGRTIMNTPQISTYDSEGISELSRKPLRETTQDDLDALTPDERKALQ